MTTLTRWFIAAALLGCFAIGTAPAAVDMFLEIGGISGESTDEVHNGEIEILGFSWGTTNSGSPQRGGAGASKANIHDFSFFKSYDAASPDLLIACATGAKIPEAVFTVRYESERAGAPQRPNDEFLVVTLTDVFVSSVTEQADGQGEQGSLVEKIVLSFSHILIEYTPIDPLTGQSGETIIVGYDLKKNKVDTSEYEDDEE